MICGSREKSMCMHHPPICLSVCLSVCLSIYLSVCLSVCQSVCQSVCLSVCLSVCQSVCLSVCLSVYLSTYLIIQISSGAYIASSIHAGVGFGSGTEITNYHTYISMLLFPFYKNPDSVPPRKPAQRTNSHCTRRSNVAVSVPLSFSAVHEYVPESVCLKLLDQRSS